MRSITTLEQFWALFPFFGDSNTADRLTTTAKLLGCSTSTIRGWQRQKLLPKTAQISLENLIANLETARLSLNYAYSKGLPWPAILSFLNQGQRQ